jgi:hypothetical protein
LQGLRRATRRPKTADRGVPKEERGCPWRHSRAGPSWGGERREGGRAWPISKSPRVRQSRNQSIPRWSQHPMWRARIRPNAQRGRAGTPIGQPDIASREQQQACGRREKTPGPPRFVSSSWRCRLATATPPTRACTRRSQNRVCRLLQACNCWNEQGNIEAMAALLSARTRDAAGGQQFAPGAI